MNSHQSYHPSTPQLARPLKAEHFLLLTQQNEHYRRLLATMTQKEAVLTARI
jgi:hypothetical protein